jgi:bile acid:Na+ symporter, BASS family
MANSWLITLLMPMAIAAIMFGLGMALTIQDFKRVYHFKKLVFAGLGAQLLILPLICFGLVYLFELPPYLGVGMMILSASPGGPSANLFSHLADADLALNISLTAVNSLLAIISIPLIINLSLWHFFPMESGIGLNFVKTAEVIVIIAFPITLGMLVREKRPNFASSSVQIVKLFSALFLLAVIIIAVIQEWQTLTANFNKIGLAVIVFNILSLAIGYFVAKAFKASERQAFAVSIEIGIHNGTLAIYIALHLLNNAEMAIPAAIYSIFMYLSAFVFVYFFRKLRSKA